MMHVWSPCLLSLLLICFFIGSTATVTTSLSHHEGYASRQDINKMPSKAKVSPMLARASTDNKNKSDAETFKMTNNVKRLKQVSLEKGHIPKKSSSKENVVVTRCDLIAKVSSKSIPSSVKEASISNEKCQKNGRKLIIPRQQDMDAFVAYADYRGPQRHPPRNN